MNNCTIYGRLGQDAEFTIANSGTKILKFSVANNTGFGEKKKTNWFRCVMFGERGEKLVEHLKKGSAVVVAGEVTLNTWQSQDGTDRAELSLNVRDVSFAGTKPEGEQSSAPAKAKQGQPAKGSAPLGGPVSFDDDDIPF